jgi:nucleoside-triphosphatase
MEQLGDLRLAGFLTAELREHGEQVGFEAVGLGGRRAILAHTRLSSPVSVGRYGVEPDHLVPLIEEELVQKPGIVDAFLIDEIGKMKCHCLQFVATMRRLLGDPIPVLATIALRGGGFIAVVKNRPDVEIVVVTQPIGRSYRDRSSRGSRNARLRRRHSENAWLQEARW